MNREIDHDLLCMGCMRERENAEGPCPYCGYEEKQEGPSHYLPCRSLLNGKYLVGKVIGEGGFGITYLGWDLNLDMKVAIKEYYPSGLVTRVSASSPVVASYTGEKAEYYNTGKNKFVQEAKTLARFFALPGIVGVKDFFQESNTSYIVMEYIEGVTLKEYLRQSGGKIPARKVLEWMKPLIHSLEEIHRAGLIHRDISPDNIMITDDDKVKLLDFGAARDISPDGGKSLSVMLKPGYAPEEQYRTHGSQGPWTDVYALCATMYKCMTGVTPPEPLERMREDTLQRPALLGAVLTPAQEEAILQGLSVDGRDRFQSMEALERALYSDEGSGLAYAGGQESAGQSYTGRQTSSGQPYGGRQETYGQYQEGDSRTVPVSDAYSGRSSAGYQQMSQGGDDGRKKNRKKLIAAIASVAVLLCISCMVLLLLPGGKKDKEEEQEKAKQEEQKAKQEEQEEVQEEQEEVQEEQKEARRYGNTACNLLGVGLAVPKDEDTYFKVYFNWVEDEDARDIAEICLETSDRSVSVPKKLNDGFMFLCSYWDSWVYYIDMKEYYLWRVREDGSETEQVSREPVSFYQIMDGKIYYTDEDQEALFVMEPDGSSCTAFVEGPCGACIGVWDGWVYYSKRENGQHKIYRIRADGTENTFVFAMDETPVFAVTENGIYYEETDEEKRSVSFLKKKNLDGSETAMPRIAMETSANDAMFNIHDGWLYYGNADEGAALYRIREDGTGKEKITDKKPMAVYEAGDNIVFIDQDYQWYMYDGSGVWPKYSGGKVEKTEEETEKITEAEITEPEVPKTEAWTESAEGYTEAGEAEDASGIMYGGAKFAYLDSVLERIDNEDMFLVPLGTQNKAHLFYYTIKDARYIRDPGLGEASQDCLVITVEMATEIDEPGYTMKIDDYDFIAAMKKEGEDDIRFCLPQSYRDPDTDGEDEWHSYGSSMPLAHGAFRTREINFPIPKGYDRFTIIQTNITTTGEANGPLFLTQDQ